MSSFNFFSSLFILLMAGKHAKNEGHWSHTHPDYSKCFHLFILLFSTRIRSYSSLLHITTWYVENFPHIMEASCFCIFFRHLSIPISQKLQLKLSILNTTRLRGNLPLLRLADWPSISATAVTFPFTWFTKMQPPRIQGIVSGGYIPHRAKKQPLRTGPSASLIGHNRTNFYTPTEFFCGIPSGAPQVGGVGDLLASQE